MTEEEKDRLRQAKADVTAALAAVRIEDYRLGEVDTRIEDYEREVATNPDGHNLYEQLGVLRFFGFCRRYGINATEVQRFFTLYESLYFPGKAGQGQCTRILSYVAAKAGLEAERAGKPASAEPGDWL